VYVSRVAEVANAISEWRKPEFSGAIKKGRQPIMSRDSPRWPKVAAKVTCQILAGFGSLSCVFERIHSQTALKGQIAIQSCIHPLSTVISIAHPAGIEPATIGLEDRW
jgi:hypothetical protein